MQREHLRADAGCVGAVHHVCAGNLHQDGCADGRGGGHGNGAAAEDQLQDSGHQEGEKQDRHIGAGEAVCDDVADAAGLDDVAECAACAGDEDDGTAALNTALEAIQNLLTGLVAGQTVDGHQQGDGNGDDGLPGSR